MLQKMKKIRAEGDLDYMIVFLVLFLFGFGLVMIYSASSYKGSLIYNNPAYWLERQAVFGGIGIVLMILLSKLDYHVLRKRDIYPIALYGVMMFLLIATWVFAAVSHGSKRWLTFGPLSIQPSELSKAVMIIILATLIYNHSELFREGQKGWKAQFKGVALLMVFAIVPIAIVAVENLSTSLILLAITAIMIFVVSPNVVPLVVLGIGAGGFGGIFVLMQSYRMDRITAWLHPATSPKGEQTMQGLYAIGSGGLFGKGLGHSIQKLGFVPESHNDMIFSIICEELGFFGAICVLALFLVLIWRFARIAYNAKELYGSMIVVGVIAHISIQTFVNIGVVTNTIPNTGVPLPFISYGGSSLIFLFAEMGIVLSVSRYAKT